MRITPETHHANSERPFTRLPLTGYIRMVSKVEAANVFRKGYFFGGEFFEVRAGRLPDVAYMAAFENAQGQSDTPDNIIFFPKSCVTSCRIDNKHPDYRESYPAIASTDILTHQFSRQDCTDVMQQVKRRVKQSGIQSLNEEQQFILLSKNPLFTKDGKVIGAHNSVGIDLLNLLNQLLSRQKTK